MKFPIKKYGDPILMRPTNPIDVEKTPQAVVQLWYDNLRDSMLATDNGIAIAANQIGINVSMFVYTTDTGEYVGVINPVLRNASREAYKVEEGCLSIDELTIRGLERCSEIVVDYWEFPSMVKYENRVVSGFEAQIFQHEMDHLDGFTILERAEPGQEFIYREEE